MTLKQFSILAKIALSGALLYLVLKIADPKASFDHLRQANLYMFFAAYLGLQFVFFLQALRWKALVDPICTQNISLGAYYYHNLLGHFYNQFLPTSIGGDAVKSYSLGRKISNQYASLTSILINRWMGLIWILIFFWSFYLINGQKILNRDFQITILVTTCFAIAFALFFYFKKNFKENFIGKKLNPLLEAIQKFNKITLFKNFIFSGLMQFAIFGVEFLVYKSVGLNISFIDILSLMPIVYLVTLLPISISGYGLREGIFIYLFTHIAQNSESLCLSGVWLSYLLSISQAILAGIAILIFKDKSWPITTTSPSAKELH